MSTALSKLIAAVKHTTFYPQKTFPRVVLKENFLTLPAVSITSSSIAVLPEDVSAPTADVRDAPIVEIRRSDERLEGLGFFDAVDKSVAVFHITKSCHNHLPIIDADFFDKKISTSFDRRRGLISPRTTCFRAVHGIHDELPGIAVDQFCSAFYRVQCGSYVGERLLMTAVELIRRRGAEDVMIEGPSLDGATQLLKINSVTTSAIKNVYQEDGIHFKWPSQQQLETIRSRPPLLKLRYRRVRRAVRDMCAAKRVLCVMDTAGGMSLNAILTASHVSVVEPDPGMHEYIRDLVHFNHGKEVFHKISLHSSWKDVDGSSGSMGRVRSGGSNTHRVFDIAAVELLGRNRDEEALVAHCTRRVASDGIVILQCESGASTMDSAVRWVTDAAEADGRSAQVITTFGPSVDFPVHVKQPAYAGSPIALAMRIFAS